MRSSRVGSCALLSCLAVACGEDPSIAPGPIDARWPDAAFDAAPPDAPVDAAPPDAAPPDAPPPDAAPTGQLLVSWAFLREGVADPIVTCEDLLAEIAWIGFGSTSIYAEVPCTDYFALIPDLPPQTIDPFDVLIVRPGPTGGFLSRVSLRADGPVTIVAGSTTYVPLVLRLFDEPYPQLQQLFDGATAYYAASPDPKVFPSGLPNTAPPLFTCAFEPDHICEPDPSLWTSPPFSDLGFSVTGLSRFSFQFTSAGSGPTATFMIRASADYDTDTVLRRYTINGSVAADGITVIGDATVLVEDFD